MKTVKETVIQYNFDPKLVMIAIQRGECLITQQDVGDVWEYAQLACWNWKKKLRDDAITVSLSSEMVCEIVRCIKNEMLSGSTSLLEDIVWALGKGDELDLSKEE